MEDTPQFEVRSTEPQKPQKKKKSKFLFLVKFSIFFAILIFVLSNFGVVSHDEDGFSFFGQIKQLVTSGEKPIKGEAEDRINIVLLGTGGIGHNGPNLTDTIVLASIRPSDQKIGIISIPRDMLVDFEGYGKRKINHVFALAEADEIGSGGDTTSKIVENIFNIPIHYFVQIDFEGFVKLIDDIGGITVNVENTLDDEYYPIYGQETATTSQRYEHLYVEKGIRHMNGDTALKFVRSRKASGIEGSDFARSQRQQRVLLAIKEKILSFGTLFQPSRISKITKTLQENMSLNVEAWEMLRLYALTKNADTTSITSAVLNDAPNSPLKAYAATDAYFLTTKTGDNSELQKIAQTIFNADFSIDTEFIAEDAMIVEDTITTIIPDEKIRVAVHNGTKINGLASRVANFLTEKNYHVIEIANSPDQTYKNTVMYNLSKKRNSRAIQTFNDFFNGISLEAPLEPITNQDGTTINYEVDESADFLVILGLDQEGKF